MKKLFNLMTSTLVIVGLASTLAIATPQPSMAACKERLLTFPTWYRGVVDKTTCEVKPPSQADDAALNKFIWKVVLNIIDMLMQLVAYASVTFLIIGGFRYITATGEPAKMTDAKSTITNAIIGLVIALASVAIVNAIAGIV